MAGEDFAWRENVVASLAEIKTQLVRLAADRESEKDAIVRATAALAAEDRRNVDKLEEHVEWNDQAHAELNEKISKVSHRQSFITGVILTIQFILTLAVGVLAIFK